MNEQKKFREPEGREHLVYVDGWGRPDKCTDECPGCHWIGNECESVRIGLGCDICDPKARRPRVCPRCDGMGEYLAHESIGGRSHISKWTDCPECRPDTKEDA